jgi:hypothetical protein
MSFTLFASEKSKRDGNLVIESGVITTKYLHMTSNEFFNNGSFFIGYTEAPREVLEDTNRATLHTITISIP